MNQADGLVKASIKNIVYLCLISTALSQASPAKAQITPDNTLGAETSQLNQNQIINGALGDKINGGATRGSNLFHSFSVFNIQDGQRVYFANPSSIENILTRVTGGNPSNIFGTLGVDGTANLFLINPSGILFGQNAQLDVQGSFVGTTANGVQFGNQGIFNATNPKAPALLTIQPSALWFNQLIQNSGIQNNSVAPAGIDSSGVSRLGLQVGDGKSLLLVGGNVSMDNGKLNALGGRVELGGLAEPGNINLVFNSDNLSLKFPLNVTRASVLLTNEAGVFVAGAGGGDIAINARNIEILGKSVLSAGIGMGLGTPETVAGDITVNATGEIKIAGSESNIRNLVRLGAKGKGGNITIDSGSFSLSDGAQLVASISGQGNAGNVTVSAKNAVSLANNVGILSTVQAGGVGKGGNIEINAATLSLTDGAQVSTITRGASDTQPAGKGDAGNVNIKVAGAVDIAGQTNDDVRSGISSFVSTGAEGNGGNITIDSGSFSLRDRAVFSASTYAQGNAGNVTVAAKNAVSLANAGIFSAVGAGGVGKGGNININAATLSLTDGAELSTFTSSAFDTQPAGRGDAGNVNIKVTGAVDIAAGKDGFQNGIRSFVSTGAEGNGGNITIDSGSFSLSDRAVLIASTFGVGNAGNVTVGARNAISLANAYILSTVESGGVGKGGSIDINAATLSLSDGAQLLTITRDASDTQSGGRRDAGNVNIKVTGAVDITGEKNGFFSGIRSSVSTGTFGNGGNITIDSGSFSLRDRAQLSASTSGVGNAGNVTVGAKDAVSLADNAYILSTVESGGVGKGGNIDINAATLSLVDGAQLLTFTREASDTQPAGRGDAGNVNILVTGAVDIAGQKNGFESAIFSNVDTGRVGNGGNITINSGSFSLRDRALLIASTSGVGNAGNVTVSAKDAVSLANAGIFSTVEAGGVGEGGSIEINSPKITLDNESRLAAETASGNGGNIKINSDFLLLRRNSGISTSAGTEKLGGDGGNININSRFIVAPPNENSDISADAFTGTGGNIQINSQGIFGIEPRQKFTPNSDITASSELGVFGVININAPDNSFLQNTFTGFSPNVIDTNALIANTCISRGTKRQENSFTITGSGALRYSPGNGFVSPYTTGDVRSVEPTSRPWKKGDPIIEPQGVYRLPNGQLILSRSC
ncbi:MAG: filamentous hemagglutinin N-terminal domain-containing protein [Nostoc sp.]|uniref:two-partner secretion domain-containing protein n=1 Tax=Nostoc sp. TaxID=1180 RepID=UPI002FFBA6CA